MRTWNWHFWLCLAGTILLAAGVVFLPRHISRNLDKKDLNWVELSERTDFSFLEPGNNSILENERAFRHLTRDGENLVLISSIHEPGRINSELLEQVYDQVMTAAEIGMLPWLGPVGYNLQASLSDSQIKEVLSEPYVYWADQVQFARYYNLSYESENSPNKTEMVNFWYLRFSDNKTFDYYFIVNAISYQIYYAEIYNTYTDFYAKLTDRDVVSVEIAEKIAYDQMSPDYYLSIYDGFFASGCMEYYGADAYNWVGSETLYEKLGLVILYYDEQPVYISQSVVQNCALLSEGPDSHAYRGIGTGFQELAGKVRFLTE